MIQPREYGNPLARTALIILVFGALLLGVLKALGSAQASFITIPFIAILALFAVFGLFAIFLKTRISDDGISSKTLFGTRTLKWGEISRVSGRGDSIKLHDYEGDVTVAPNPRLTGYAEVVEAIGIKRPDLFSAQEYGELSRSWLGTAGRALYGLVFIGAALFGLFSGEFIEEMITFLACLAIGTFVIVWELFAPRSIVIQGGSIVVGYFFKQANFSAREISKISFNHSNSLEAGRNSYVELVTEAGKAIRFSGLQPSQPIAYLALKTWHRSNAKQETSYFQEEQTWK